MIQIPKPELCDTNQLADEIGINHTAITFDGEFLNVEVSSKDQKKIVEIAAKHIPAWANA